MIHFTRAETQTAPQQSKSSAGKWGQIPLSQLKEWLTDLLAT